MSLESFRVIAERTPDAGRIILDEPNATPVRAERGILGRIMSWFRNPTGREAEQNRAAVQSFSEAIRARFGDRIARLAFSSSGELLDTGKPLSARTIRQVLTKAVDLEQAGLMTSGEVRSEFGPPPGGELGQRFSGLMANLDSFHEFPGMIRGLVNSGMMGAKEGGAYLRGFGAGKLSRLEALEKQSTDLIAQLKGAGYGDRSPQVIAIRRNLQKIQGEITREANRGAPVPRNLAGMELGFGNVVSSQPLGQGKMAQVSKVTYQLPGQEPRVVAFKPEPTRSQGGKPIDQYGIRGESPRGANLAGRAVGAYKVDQMLELNMTPRTDFAFHDGDFGVAQDFAPGDGLITLGWQDVSPQVDQNIRVDYLMRAPDPSEFRIVGEEKDLAKLNAMRGRDGVIPQDRKRDVEKLLSKLTIQKSVVTDVAPIDFSEPARQKALVDAQVLDLLCGQMDRNSGNFIYGRDGRISLIDNDQAFGAGFDRFEPGKQRGSELPGLPPLMSLETGDKIRDLDPDRFTAGLAGTGLTPEEIGSARARLMALKEHVETLRQNGKLVTEWNRGTYDELMRTPNNNYVAQQVQSRWQAVSTSPNRVEIFRRHPELLADPSIPVNKRMEILRAHPELVTEDLARGGDMLIGMARSMPPFQPPGAPRDQRRDLIRLMRSIPIKTPEQARGAARVARELGGPDGGRVTPENVHLCGENFPFILNAFFEGNENVKEVEALRAEALGELHSQGILTMDFLDGQFSKAGFALGVVMAEDPDGELSNIERTAPPVLNEFPSMQVYRDEQRAQLLPGLFLQGKMLQTANPALTRMLQMQDGLKLRGARLYNARANSCEIPPGVRRDRVEPLDVDTNKPEFRAIYARMTPALVEAFHQTPPGERAAFLRDRLGIEVQDIHWRVQVDGADPSKGKVRGFIGDVRATDEQIAQDVVARYLLGMLE